MSGEFVDCHVSYENFILNENLRMDRVLANLDNCSTNKHQVIFVGNLVLHISHNKELMTVHRIYNGEAECKFWKKWVGARM